MNKQRKKFDALRPKNALTAFILLMILSIVLGYTIVFLNDTYGFDGSEPSVIDSYEMCVWVEYNNDTTIAYDNGTTFYLTGKNTEVGKITSYMPGGDVHSSGYYLIMEVRGSYSEYDGFKLNGLQPLSAGELISIHSDYRHPFIAEISYIKKI
ncbi:MAG: hypothetical protein IJW19_04715 [Clostridia bacterium]|nr:hypothetical protein [Clostridia bacterium]